jgi:transposase
LRSKRHSLLSPSPQPQQPKAVGLDAGIEKLTTLPDGRYLENQKPLEYTLEEIKRIQKIFQERSFSRKTGLRQS